MIARTISVAAFVCLLAGCARQPAPQAASVQPAGQQQQPPQGPSVPAATDSAPAAGVPAAPATPSQAPYAEAAPERAPRPVAAPTPEPPARASAPHHAAAAKPSAFRSERAAEVVRPAAVTIPAGTRIRVRLGETLDTKHVRAGEGFVAHLAEPIVDGDRVLVPKGAVFHGHVVEARSSGRFKGRAYLGVTLDSFQLHGATYEIATGSDVRSSSSHKKRNMVLMGGGSGVGAAIGAIAGGGVGALIGAGAGAAAGTTGAFITGKKNVKLPAETPLVFSLRAPVTIRG